MVNAIVNSDGEYRGATGLLRIESVVLFWSWAEELRRALLLSCLAIIVTLGTVNKWWPLWELQLCLSKPVTWSPSRRWRWATGRQRSRCRSKLCWAGPLSRRRTRSGSWPESGFTRDCTCWPCSGCTYLILYPLTLPSTKYLCLFMFRVLSVIFCRPSITAIVLN